MCTSCNEPNTIFSVEIATKEPVNNNMELYKEIAHRLFQSKVISNISIGNNKAYVIDDRQIFGFHLHLCNKNNPLSVNLENVEKALNGLLDSFEDYYEMKIELNLAA